MSKPWLETMYEIGHIQNGSLVRGGIKMSLTKAGEYVERFHKEAPEVQFLIMIADEEAITEEELIQELYQPKEEAE